MPHRDPGSELLGREAERATLDELLATVRGGQSRVLVVRGESGIGKTALLEYLMAKSSGFRTCRAAGVESEMELAYAGVQQLCAPIVDHLGNLPDPQRQALAVALGLQGGARPDLFLVGLAVLSLLADAAEEEPLLCVVDDAHWLDRMSAKTLAFVARRLLAERVALVFGEREPTDQPELVGLPELVIRGLDERDARELLAVAIRGRVDEQVRARILAETRGNPLALLELPRGLTPAELAAGFAVADQTPITSRLEDRFLRRLEALPSDTRRLLLTAAAEPVGDTGLFWRAIEHQGIAPRAIEAAEAGGLIEISGRVRFRHPLVRSVTYRSASFQERRVAHDALAEVTDPEVDPDRRAWHRALASSGPDEDLARELEQSAGRAQGRGGFAAAAALLEYAAILTPESSRRAERRLAASEAKFEAGALDAALQLLDEVEAGPPDGLRTALVARLRGKIALDRQQPREAVGLLLGAARRLEALDADLARETHLESVAAAFWTSRPGTSDLLLQAAEAAVNAPAGSGPRRVVDVVLDAMALRFTRGYAASAPSLRRALDLLRAIDTESEETGRSLWRGGHRVAGIIAFEVWDFEAAQALAEQQVRLARDSGALVELQFALNFLGSTHLLAGALDAAAEVIDEDRLIAVATGNPPVSYLPIWLAALEGEEEKASDLVNALIEHATSQGLERLLEVARYNRAVLDNGLGRYDAARDAARFAIERDPIGNGRIITELAEAASRTGDFGIVDAALEWISQRTRATPTEWALATEARIAALRGEGDAAERLYRESIERLARTPIRTELARGHLLYGEWLRREGRRVDARTQLRIAHDMLTTMGLGGFAERARRELLATGETVRKRTVETRLELTPQEVQIARLASEGKTNPEIGAQLFIGSRTVEWHLGKIFTKLGITSRRYLRDALPAELPASYPLP